MGKEGTLGSKPGRRGEPGGGPNNLTVRWGKHKGKGENTKAQRAKSCGRRHHGRLRELHVVDRRKKSFKNLGR